MADYGRIRRNRSALGNGLVFGQRRRGISPWFLLFWLVAMGVVAVIIWQFNTIQPRVLAMVGSAATPTPNTVEYARLGDRAFWSGDLDGAVNNYRMAAQLMPDNVNVLYELTRVLVYRSYGDIRNAGDISEAEIVGRTGGQGCSGQSPRPDHRLSRADAGGQEQ